MNTLPIIFAALLLHAQLAFAAGCDLPMFAGARLFAAASSGAQFMATADFNHDGFLDLVTTDTNSTVVLLGNSARFPGGNGNGTFQAATRYPMGTAQSLAPGPGRPSGRPSSVDEIDLGAKSGSRRTRADRGVRPTILVEFSVLEKNECV